MDPMGSKGAELLYKSWEATREPIGSQGVTWKPGSNMAAREPL